VSSEYTQSCCVPQSLCENAEILRQSIRSRWPRGLKGRVCVHSSIGSAGSNPGGSKDVWLFVVCYKVEVSATSRSVVQMSPTECGVPEDDREIS
jgi:hypothetical protein